MVKPEDLPEQDKRILGVLPNYKTVNDPAAPYQPITWRDKMYIARHDSFDPPMFGIAAFMAGFAQLADQYPTWGQGLKGFGKRYAAAMGDQAIGNYLTEGILPSVLHHDPRYFRLGEGKSTGRRVTYALTRVLISRNDSGHNTFNTSEILGTAGAASIAAAYYPSQQRNLHNIAQRFYTQVAFDAFSGVLKEYWPDIRRKMFKK